MRNLIGLLAVGVLAAACGTSGLSPKVSGDKLYEAVGQSIVVIDSRSHATERHLPLGSPSGDWRHLYSMLGESLIDTNPATGDTQNSLTVGAEYQLPPATHSGLPGGLSPAGRWLVLQAYDDTAAHTYMAAVDTSAFKVTDKIDLKGRFNFDAISDDGQRLYLIQYLNGKEYYVRLFDIAVNRLEANIVVDKSDGNQAMAGVRLSGIAAPDGSNLFSMYVRENESPFIHALSLQGPFAFCLDLPGDGYAKGKGAMQWALAMNHEGSRVYAINGSFGVVAEVDSSRMQVLRTAHLDAGTSSATGADSAVLTADGKTLIAASSTGIVWVDTSTLKARMEGLTEWEVWGLSLSPDGKTLYAVNDRGQIAAISTTSGAVSERFDPGAGKPIALMRVASA